MPSGQGSIWIDPDLSTLTLVNGQQSIFLNAMTWPASGASRWDPNEPNDNPGVCASLQYGIPVVDAGIDPPGDWDWFCFSGVAGEIIAIDVDADAIGSSLDPVLELYAPGGAFLAVDDDTHGLDPYLTWALTQSGTHYVRVRSFAHPCCGGPTFFYTLLVDVIGATAVPDLPADLASVTTGIDLISPSPARGSTRISFGVGRGPVPVHLDVYDVAGRHIRRLTEGLRGLGHHEVVWDGRNDGGTPVASGVYFVSMQVERERWTKRVMLLR